MRDLVAVLLALAGSACTGSDGITPELVVTDARLGGGAPRLLGATATTLFWATSPADGALTSIAAVSLTSLPAQGRELTRADGLVAHAGDHVAFVADGVIGRVDASGTVGRITAGAPDALAGNAAPDPVIAWAEAAEVSWGVDDAQRTVTLNRVVGVDHLRVTGRSIYAAVDGATGRRLVRIDQASGDVTPVTSSETWAAQFPRGGIAGSTYVGHIVGADDDGALWLVDELPSRRALLVDAPVQGEPTVLLEYVMGATAFFASDAALYWQEGDTLLTAPRTGGAASIAAELPGPAGGFADGFVYVTRGDAIERLRVE